MDVANVSKAERTIDVREISPRIRHTVILQLFEHLDDVSSLQLIADHDPRPLRLQLETKYGERCRWTYLEQGPDLWRVRLRYGGRQIEPEHQPRCGVSQGARCTRRHG